MYASLPTISHCSGRLLKSSSHTLASLSALRQAFTEGERWPVQEKRIAALLSKNLITSDQADIFRKEGAIGSHLENLERNDGFKGFNQKGVSEIINATDPRRQASAGAFETVSYKTIDS